MSDERVPLTFRRILGNDVHISRVPSAADWKTMADDANWLLGRGSQLVPCTMLTSAAYSGSTSYTYELMVFPRKQALERVWTFGLITSGSETINFHVSASSLSGSFVDNTARTTVTTRESFLHLVESVPNPTINLERLAISCSFNGIDNLPEAHITSLSIWEIPRARLSITRSSDDGVREGTSAFFGVRTPIWGDSTVAASDTKNVRGVALAVSSAVGTARRSGVWYYLAPNRIGGFLNIGRHPGPLYATTTRAYFSDVSSSIQARRVYPNQLSASLDVWIYARLGVGTGQHLIVEFETGIGRYAITGVMNTTAPFWFSGSIMVPTDGTSATGSATPAGGTPRFNFSYRTTSSTAVIWSVCIGEHERSS